MSLARHTNHMLSGNPSSTWISAARKKLKCYGPDLSQSPGTIRQQLIWTKDQSLDSDSNSIDHYLWLRCYQVHA